MIFLSHILNADTPTYGNRNKFLIEKKSDISKGDIANDTHISTTVHIGTHIDMPYHFYEEGKTVTDFDDDFWKFRKPLIIEIIQDELIINKKLIERLSKIKNIGYDILIVKTNSHRYRKEERYWKNNCGFHPDIYTFLAQKFSNIRVIGFDTISVSSFENRALGREAHKAFLNPIHPILLLEDMKLDMISESTDFDKIIVAPLRIEKCDGLPCTVLGLYND